MCKRQPVNCVVDNTVVTESFIGIAHSLVMVSASVMWLF